MARAAQKTPLLSLSGATLCPQVPAGAVLRGISLSVGRANRVGDTQLVDDVVQLVANGATSANQAQTSVWTGPGRTYEYVTYGGPTELWGASVAFAALVVAVVSNRAPPPPTGFEESAFADVEAFANGLHAQFVAKNLEAGTTYSQARIDCAVLTLHWEVADDVQGASLRRRSPALALNRARSQSTPPIAWRSLARK